MRPINTALLSLAKRAETYDRDHLVQSFVDIGPVFTLLSNIDSQILYGRRGTGKTHILSYLANEISKQGKLTVQIDMRTLGSTGGIYSDSRISLSERATRLLVDTVTGIHDVILSEILDKSDVYDLSKFGPLLDCFADAATEVIVEGDVNKEIQEEFSDSVLSADVSNVTLSKGKLDCSFGIKNEEKATHIAKSMTKRTGKEKLHIHFGGLGKQLKNIVDQLPGKQLWIMLDEWSEVPLDLQPYLADLLRRTVFAQRGVIVKIAAIEQRCNFRISEFDGNSIGIEVGADVATSINLDEFLVFDNNAELAKQFFSDLLFKHILAMPLGQESLATCKTSANFVNFTFTQRNAFDEFVRAAEGVPRDALNIVGIAAQKAMNNQISIPDIRGAALTWYQRAKQQAIASRASAQDLLTWIIEEVIKNKQARAFLLSNDTKDSLIDFLYDSRVLHFIRQGVSAQDIPGKRFNVFGLDYGCYVDLINTIREPKGLFEIDGESGPEFIEVPQTDFRSIRRAILNLDEYYKGRRKVNE